MSAKLKVAVIGVGSLGKEHARLYADLAATGQITFAGIYDVSASQAAKIAGKLGVPILATLDDAWPAPRPSAL
jgi:predicted dehydrogenase